MLLCDAELPAIVRDTLGNDNVSMTCIMKIKNYGEIKRILL